MYYQAVQGKQKYTVLTMKLIRCKWWEWWCWL